MSDYKRGRVLVVGMGISGIATAARLHRAGWTPVIIERAADRRSGGYFVGLFGAGQAAARRLGILEHLHDRTSSKPGLDIDRDGRTRPGMTYADVPGKPWLMLRGDVEKAAFAALPDDVEVRYSTVPTAIAQDAAPDERRIFVVDNRLQILLRRIMPVLGKTKLGKRLSDRVMKVDEIVKYKSADIVGKILGERPTSREETPVA